MPKPLCAVKSVTYIIHLKHLLQSKKTQSEIDICNTTEYDVRSYQVKSTIVKWTKVRPKGFKFNRSQKETLIYLTSMLRNIYI